MTLHLSHIGLTLGLTFILNLQKSVFLYDLLIAVDNSALSQVIGRHFNFNLVAFEDSDVVDTQFSAEIREYFVSVVEYYSELGFRQNLNHFAFGFDYVFL